MSTLAVPKPKTPYGNEIKADATTGELPTRIELLKVGVWRTPYHGDFMITPEDLQEYVDNFTAGIGLAGDGKAGAPIDFSHNNEQLAAGWIKSLETDGTTLYGNVKWSTAGKEALTGDEFKFFSPEFYPKGRGGWMDPEDYEHLVDNVLTGGGLTNIPLFKTLGALMASAGGHQEHRINQEYINASEIKEKSMTVQEQIAEYRKVEVSKLDETAKAFVTAHAAEMTDEDKTYFGLDSGISAAAQAALDAKNKQENQVDAETAQIAADIKAGKSVVISADAFNKMKTDQEAQAKEVDALRRDKVTAHVEAGIAKGKIVADQKDKWVTRIMADQTMQEDFDALPVNEILADAQGSSTNASDATAAAEDTLHSKTVEAIKAAAEKGVNKSYTDARREVLASDKDLASKINQVA